MAHALEMDRFNEDDDFFLINFNDPPLRSNDFNDFSEDLSFLFSESDQSQIRPKTWIDPEPIKKYDISPISSTPLNVTVGGATIRRAELDMNDPYVLDLYTQLVIFQRDKARNKVEFDNSDHSKQDVLYSLARKLGLEYEYSLFRRQVTISKASWIDSTTVDFLFPEAERSSLDIDVAYANRSQHSELDHPKTTSSCWPIELALAETLNSVDPNTFDLVEIPDIAKTPERQPNQRQQEFVFVSDPAGSPQKEPSHGRNGRVDKTSRAESRAVKAVGACWKCKYLRKKCTGNLNSPCDTCRKGENDSTWRSIGCRRGPLECQVPPVNACPKRSSQLPGQPSPFSSTTSMALQPNSVPRPNILKKYKAERKGCSVQAYISDITLQLSSVSASECVLKMTRLYELQLLLFRAVLPYSDSEYDLLVSKSLAVLRSCLEVIRVEISGKLSSKVHQACTPTICSVDHLGELDLQMQEYLNELSRTMFKKKNLRGDKDWWLPTFYSLCIQSLVRKGLVSVFGTTSTNQSDSTSSIQYLQLAAQLFVALSPGFDAFMRSKDWSLKDLVKAPRLAAGHARWINEVLTSSSRYLLKLFNVDTRTNTLALPIFDSSENTASFIPTPLPPPTPSCDGRTDPMSLGKMPHIEAEKRRILERAREGRFLAAAKLIQRIWRDYKSRRELRTAMYDASDTGLAGEEDPQPDSTRKIGTSQNAAPTKDPVRKNSQSDHLQDRIDRLEAVAIEVIASKEMKGRPMAMVPQERAPTPSPSSRTAVQAVQHEPKGWGGHDHAMPGDMFKRMRRLEDLVLSLDSHQKAR